MRDSNYSYPLQNKVCVGISPSLYDRRALDTSAMLPLLNSLTHLTYLTSTSPRIRDILVNDGGLERLLEIMQESALPRDHCFEPNFDWFGLRGTPTASILTQAQQVALKHSLAFQCVVNIGVRGSETIRTRLVQSGALNVVAQIMEVWLQQKGVWIYPGPLGSQVSVERAIAAGVLPPVQDGSVDWRAGYTSRRAKEKEREKANREATKGDVRQSMEQASSIAAAAVAQEASHAHAPSTGQEASASAPPNPLRAMRRPPVAGRDRQERVSAWVEGRSGRPEDGQSQASYVGDNSPCPIASWWNDIRRGIELNLTREDEPTEEDMNLFGITLATVPAWTRLFTSIRTAGDNRRRLIRRLLRSDSSAQSIMEIMFMFGLDPWATKERLQRAVRVSQQGEVMIVTSHRNLGPGYAAHPSAGTSVGTVLGMPNHQPPAPQSETVLDAQQESVASTSDHQMDDVAAEENHLSLPTPRASANRPLVDLTAPLPPPYPTRRRENSVRRPLIGREASDSVTSVRPAPSFVRETIDSAQSIQRTSNAPSTRRPSTSAREAFDNAIAAIPRREVFANTRRGSSTAQSVSSTASDVFGAESPLEVPSREQSRSRLGLAPDSAASSRSASAQPNHGGHLLDLGNDANSSGPSNNPSPVSTPRNGEMPRGSGPRPSDTSSLAATIRGNGRERSGTITNATFEIPAEDNLASRVTRRTSMAENHESMDIDEEDRPASRATTDAEVIPGAEGEVDIVDNDIDIVGINGEEEIGDPSLAILTEVEPNPNAQAELDIAMGAPRGAPGAAATTVAGEMTPRVPAAGLPNTTTEMTSPEPVNIAEIEGNEGGEGNVQRQQIRQAQLPVTAVVIAAGAPRSFSDLGHLVASMDRNADPHVYTDDTILLSLQLFAYLSKYPHVRSAFHHPTQPLHYGVDISPDAHLPERPNFARTNNMFSLVERFTFRAAPPDPDMPKIPADIQYWAGVIMRNACRKDDSRSGIRQCANMSCGKWEAYPRQFAKCRRCRKAKYCSKDCQSRAWQEGHRFWCNARDHETVDLGLAGTVIIPPGDRSSEFVQAQHARQRQSRFTLAMNTRQNMPIGNDEQQPVGRGARPVPGEGPAAGARVGRRDALTVPPDVAAAAVARPDSVPGATRRAVTRVDLVDGRPGLPRRNETVIGMDVDRERTLEPMDVEGLGMGAHDAVGRGGAGGGEAAAAAGVWNVHGATAFEL
ncbi:hypothetical protein QFC21_000092 [Naganishia friedmannii]|uniref:Uncharacterized protein n=1 Tax=Naganishia friedmannii TaxID=89922 RepID=A0ACC2WAV1_9TREE|nr:hypothetical protein QFC21_000092 [Naganishia friedmannii]